MTVVQNTVTDPGGNPASQINVRITLVTGSVTTPGYTGGGDILGTLALTTDKTGAWSATLTPNASITPANSYYQVIEGSNSISAFVVPASGGPYQLSQVLVTPPPTPSGVGITGVQVAEAGTVVAVRPEINLIAGAGVTVSAADNPSADRVDVTLTAAGSSGALLAVNNLSDVASVPTSRTNLGLGSAATQASSAFDAAGAAATAQATAESFATSAVGVETTRAESAEALLAPLASPALTGTPTAPTKTPLTSNTDIATTAYTDAAVTVETTRAQSAEASKAPLASPALTGSPTAPTQTTGDNSTKVATDAFVTTAVATETTRAEAAEAALLPLAGGTMSGAIAMGAHKVTGLTNGSAPTDGAAFGQIPTSAGTIGGLLAADNLSDVASPATARANLGLGSAAVLASSAVAQTANNLSDLASTATARGNLAAAKSGANSDITSLTGLTTPLPLTEGGTGQATAQAAINALAGGVTAAEYLRGNGTNIALSAIQAADLPTGTTSTQGALLLDGTATDITAPGIQAAGAIGKVPDAGHVHPGPTGAFLASDTSFLAWNYDPSYMTTGQLLSTGVLYLVRINVRAPITATNILLYLITAGATLTASQSYAGLYNSSGTLIGSTADQSTLWTSGTNVFKTMALAGGPYALSAGYYWVGIVSNGTTPPTFGRWTSYTTGSSNAGLTNSGYRWATNGTATSLANITPSSNTSYQQQIWAGLS